MANQVVNVRLAHADHPNGQRTVGGVTVSHKWQHVTVSDANAAILAADEAVEMEATDYTADAVVAGAFDAVAVHLGDLLSGTDVSDADGKAIVDATIAAYRNPTE